MEMRGQGGIFERTLELDDFTGKKRPPQRKIARGHFAFNPHGHCPAPQGEEEDIPDSTPRKSRRRCEDYLHDLHGYRGVMVCHGLPSSVLSSSERPRLAALVEKNRL